jgi:NAD(P)-dependent dehydrogenase (short-subunit alcohol dehydrogenase family)
VAEAVLVSGAAGGIGGPLCRQLAVAGFHPFIGFASGKDAAGELAVETGGTALALNLTEPDQIENAVATISDSPFDLAGVVLAASPPPAIEPVFRLPPGEMQNQWAVNVAGPHELLGVVVRKLMRPRKKGSIVAVLSAAMGADGTAAKSMGGYIIAKYGLLGLMKVLDAEYAWLDVQTVSPGYTETPMLDAFDPRFLDQMRAALPAGEFSSPDSVAAEILNAIQGR